ncbi:Ribosome-inactivating protein gynostemmin [Euphorbia peplus]|nr:Ribosome-inactivating protein gynostemmin [Euphorbia peplus]
MSMQVIFATWLCCTIAIASSFPTVRYSTQDTSVGCYQLFMATVRRALASELTSHGIPVLRKPSDVTNDNKYLLVQLDGDSPTETITLALNVVNAYVFGYKADEGRSFFFKDAPAGVEAANNGLFDGTTKVRLMSQDSNYINLGDRTKYPLGISSPIKNAIDILRRFDGKIIDDNFRHSFLVLIQNIAEAARFKFLQRQIEADIYDSYKPQGIVISYENKWDLLSEQIQLAGADGAFPKQVQLENDDFTPRYVSNVADVKADMGILLYKGSGDRVGDKFQRREERIFEAELLHYEDVCAQHYQL